MSESERALTGVQKEILDVIWKAGPEGASAADVWDVLSAKRGVARTTVLTHIVRLERRGWLIRRETPNGLRFVVTRDRAQASAGIAKKFIDEFFGGSASELVMSLLGSRKIKPGEIERLRKLLDASKGKKNDGSHK